MRALAFGATRLFNAFYFVATCLYCLLSHSTFANEQFIRPQLISWLPGLVARHHEWFWLTVVATVPTLVVRVRRCGPHARRVVMVYSALVTALGVWLLFNPVLPLVGQDTGTLVVAGLWLIPPFVLALVDHLTTSRPRLRAVDDRRLFVRTIAAAVLIWLTYTALLPWYIPRTPGLDFDATAVVFGVGISLGSHVLLGALLYLVAAAALSTAALSGRTYVEYLVVVALSACGLGLVLRQVVASALSFGPAESLIVSAGISVLTVATWSAVCWDMASREPPRRTARPDLASEVRDAIDLWFEPIVTCPAPVRGIAVAALPVVALGLRSAVAQFDWNFLFQKLGVALVWVLALGCAHALARRVRVFETTRKHAYVVAASVAVVIGTTGVPVTTTLSAWVGGHASLDAAFVLDRYTALDGSFHLLRDLTGRQQGEDAAFYTFLKSHSTLGRVPAEPVDVNFVDSFDRSIRPPHVFLFIVDSLRPDYLSPYNRAVTFTPAVSRFADESLVFERAFTRYGSTGLSVPALWAGGMLLHKQYVMPFAPMNALEKLLDAVGYRRFMSDDHLVTGLFRPSSATTLLDGNVQEMDHTMCGTTRELRVRLEESTQDPRPIFAMTRPLQLHTARLVRDPPTRPEAYPGFVPGYAAQVEAVDRCFGEFVEYLKTAGLYDESVVVLTSDHGESLGEEGRWGHGNALHPELLRIPLLLHIPHAMANEVAADRSQIALSTDITPTLYLLAGQAPRDLGPLYGRPLVTRVGAPIPSRRRESFLASASYGPGYALLRHNARTLYVADATQGREFAYEMDATGTMVRQTVTTATRAVDRAIVREHIGRIASEYKFSPIR